MRRLLLLVPLLLAAEPTPPLIVKPDAFSTLVNPKCSHCRDEAKRRGDQLKEDDRVLCWTRGYSDGGAIPFRFFLNPYRVISDTYGVFVYDPDAGFARGFAPSLDFRFHGWRNGVMVMRHKDGTLYSCLTGLAFDGPNKGKRLPPVPTLVSNWGFWLKRYPGAVAYHMFDKYQSRELPDKINEDSRKSRPSKVDKRLPADTFVLGVHHGDKARAYPLESLAKAGLLRERVGEDNWVILWYAPTGTAAAYLPIASPPPPSSPPKLGGDEGGGGVRRAVTLELDRKAGEAPFVDQETKSHWDIAGRAVEGPLKGWTLTWLDGTQVKWFAWSAEYPQTSVYGVPRQEQPKARFGESEYLRSLPKRFATLRGMDTARHRVTLLIEGESLAKVWPVAPDAEIKVSGWWGRLDQLHTGDRVWVWFALDRRKQPASVCMLADELSEQDMHGDGVTLVRQNENSITIKDSAKRERTLKTKDLSALPLGKTIFVQSSGDTARIAVDAATFEKMRTEQQRILIKRWETEGLPGVVAFPHVFSGEVEVLLDHEAMRWARSLQPGAKVSLQVEPPIPAVVRAVEPWRERTRLRLAVAGHDATELRMGQRLYVKMPVPSHEVQEALLPSGLDRPRGKDERIEWLMASIYCTCGIGGDGCTGQFYTLANCNPNGCGMPKAMRKKLAKRIDEGLTDRQIIEQLLKEQGPALLRPHLLP